MRNFTLASLLVLGTTLLQTGCAAGIAVRPPVVIATRFPAPPPPPPPAPAPRPVPAPVPQMISRGEAIYMGESWCVQNRLDCRIDGAHLVHGGNVWRLHFETFRVEHHHHHGRGHHAGRGKGHGRHGDHDEWKRGKLRLEIHAYSGDLLDVRSKG